MQEFVEKEPVAYVHCTLPRGKGAPFAPTVEGGTVEGAEVSSHEAGVVEVIPLYDGQSFRIGRNRANDLVIDHPAISRFHAVLSASQAGVVVSDLSSTNGTQVNGRCIVSPVDLTEDDQVRVGGLSFRVSLASGRGDGESAEGDATLNVGCTRTTVTVLVADVCGYTSLVRELPAEEVATMLNRWFDAVVNIVHSYGGVVDKFVGDCVMALWRSSGDGEAVAAERAIAAGLAILSETGSVGTQWWEHNEERPWCCRVALNTGTALEGAFGAKSVREYTVLGDTVNIAFRLESLASEMNVPFVMTAGTASHASNFSGRVLLGSRIVDGCKEPIEVWSINPKSAVSADRNRTIVHIRS